MHRKAGRTLPALIACLWLLVLGCNPLAAQRHNNRIFRVVPSDQLQGRFGLVYESKIRGRRYMYAHKGFYRREVVVSGLNPRRAGPTPWERLHKFFLSDYQKYLLFYGGYQRQNLPDDRLLLQGPFAEMAVRRYFQHRGAEGCHLNLGLGYTALFAQEYDAELKQQSAIDVIHVPRVTLTTGWQFLFGLKNHWAVDLYAGGGWRYPITSRQDDDPALSRLPPLHLVWGVSVGFAFQHRTRYF